MKICAKCSSNNTRKLSLIAKDGTVSTNGSVKGISVGTGGVGVGAGRVRSKSRSDLAEEASFKSEESFLGELQGVAAFIFSLFIGFLIGGTAAEATTESDLGWGIVFLIVGGPIFLTLFTFLTNMGAAKKDLEKFSQDIDVYNKTWMCLDCGNKWSETKTTTKPRQLQESTSSSELKNSPARKLSINEIIEERARMLEEKEYRRRRSLINQFFFPDERLNECSESERTTIIEQNRELLKDLKNCYSSTEKDKFDRRYASAQKRFIKTEITIASL